MNEKLFVGIIQTSLDYNAAWNSLEEWPNSVQMSRYEEIRAKKEIRHYFASLHGGERIPDIILLPELSVPLGYENVLVKSAESLGAIVIAGLDYDIKSIENPKLVSNEAVIIVPSRIRGKRVSASTSTRRIGKTYGAPGELSRLKNIDVNFQANPTVWLFESVELGNFGVAICYDFMDLDRIVLYRNKIQTLFILAYNRDTTSFHHMAESIARTVFCNVVVCNCGYFGDSLAVSPFREPYNRTVYRHSGQKLYNSQVIELPLKALKAQQIEESNKDYKSLPPGFKLQENLATSTHNINSADTD